jgi:hypothetical protein
LSVTRSVMSEKSKKSTTVVEELQELRDIYLQILSVEAKLVSMEQKHPAAARLREVITQALNELEDVRHMLMKDAAEAIDSESEHPPSQS